MLDVPSPVTPMLKIAADAPGSTIVSPEGPDACVVSRMGAVIFRTRRLLVSAT